MDTIFSEGRDAFTFEKPRSSCPYPEDSDEREAWQDGWDSAEAETHRTDIDQQDDD